MGASARPAPRPAGPPGPAPAPGRPGRRPLAGGAHPGERPEHAGVSRHERVGVGQRAHPDVARRPRPDAGQGQQLCLGAVPVGAGIQRQVAGRERGGQPGQRGGPGLRHRQRGRVGPGQRLRGREAMRERAVRPLERLAVGGHQPRPEAPGRGHGHLLAEHGSQGQLVPVHVAGHPPPGVGPRQRPQHRARRGQEGGDGLRVGVQVEQAAAALHRRGQVAQVLQLQLAVEVPGPAVVRRQADRQDSRAVRQQQRPPVAAVAGRLHAGDRPRGQEAEQPPGVDRRPVRQPQPDQARRGRVRRRAGLPDPAAGAGAGASSPPLTRGGPRARAAPSASPRTPPGWSS